jgi:signal transduction histidine kinase
MGVRLPAIRRETIGAIAAALLILAAAWAAIVASPAGTISGLGVLALVALRVGAGVLSLGAANRLAGSSNGRAWRYLATAWILAAASAVLLWAGWAIRGEMLQVPSLADLLLLAGSCCAVWAVAGYGAAPKERFGRLRSWLDVLILFLSVLGLSWLILLQPVLEIGIASPVQAFWAFLWPALDLMFLALAFRLVFMTERGHERRSVGLLGLAGLAALAGDLVVGFAAITGDTAPAWRAEVMWMLAALLAALAAFEAGREPASRMAAGVSPRRTSQGEALLPIAFTYVVVGYVGVDAWIQGSVDPFGLGVAIALALLLFARQGVVAGQSEMQQYAALVEGAGEIAFICQPDGRISFSNPSFDQALRRHPARVEPLHLQDVLYSDVDVAAVLERATVEGWSGEVTLFRPDGTRFPARLTLRPVILERQRRPVLAATAVDLAVVKEREALLRSALDDVAAARTELMALNRDLEEKVGERTRELERTVEDLDRLNQELRALDRMKSEFVTLVSHELRAPLTNIRAGVELLLPEGAGIPEPARGSLRLIQAETTRLGTFVEAILDLSALDAGRFPLRLAPLDYADEARGAVERFAGVEGHERIRLGLAGDLPPVLADQRALASVLYHLLDNALKYAVDGPIELGAEPEPDRLVAWVRDHGPGIPEADRERVFDMFLRLDASDSREVYGHGLGLHLVRRLLKAMGGGIRAEAADGDGVHMAFWLPRYLATDESAH